MLWAFLRRQRQQPASKTSPNRARPQLQSLEERLALSLTPITSTFDYPKRAVVKLYTTFPDGSNFVGSGALIDPNSVLTAGHMVYSGAHGGWATTITAYAGYNNGAYAASSYAVEFWTYNAFIDHENNYNQDGNHYDEDGDLAIVTLNDALGNQVGWFGLDGNADNINFPGSFVRPAAPPVTPLRQPPPSVYVPPVPLQSLGYPADYGYDGETLYYTSGTVQSEFWDGGTLLLGWDAHGPDDAGGLSLYIGGQSGSPLYRLDDQGLPTIDGVMVSAAFDQSWGHAVELTGARVNDLIARMNDDNNLGAGFTNSFAAAEQVPAAPAPVPVADMYPVSGSRLVVSAAGGVLANDRAQDRNALQALLVNPTAHGNLDFTGDGSFTYTPANGFTGTDSFQYRVVAGATAGNVVTVTLRVGVDVPNQARRTAVADALTHSAEYFGDVVQNAYQHYLGRAAAPAEVRLWTGALQGGMTDEQMEGGFLGAPEYIARHGGSGAGWVRGMYQDLLGRTPNQAEVDGWVRALNGGMTPTQVAYGFAASDERESQRVAADYQDYLGRAANPAGVAMWVRAFRGGFTNERVISGFVGSDEYFARHGGDAADWLGDAYRDILGRGASDGEIQAWLTVL
jgi:V8-like Glu-specific endopeptidase